MDVLFADDIFKGIFLNGNILLPIKISLQFIFKDPINNILALLLSHCLNQWWLIYWHIYVPLGLNELMKDIQYFAKMFRFLNMLWSSDAIYNTDLGQHWLRKLFVACQHKS